LLRIFCVVGRHDWQTETDTDGAVTFCARCGKLVHGGLNYGESGQAVFDRQKAGSERLSPD
jgi:hypothetical protein